jgi:hypothetical protein
MGYRRGLRVAAAASGNHCPAVGHAQIIFVNALVIAYVALGLAAFLAVGDVADWRAHGCASVHGMRKACKSRKEHACVDEKRKRAHACCFAGHLHTMGNFPSIGNCGAVCIAMVIQTKF